MGSTSPGERARATRRGFLGTVAATAALAGCLGDDSPDIGEHPAATELSSQPTLGPPVGDADATIIAFEDPSCPSCARFERETFPTLKAELIDPGRLSFVFRGIPVVRAWAAPAVLALEATYARAPTAFWTLKRRYYRHQGKIEGRTLREATRQFLDGTSVDVAAVLDDVDQGVHQGAVAADRRAADDASIGGTPTFFLFSEGSFVTDIVGAQPYDAFEHALGI